MWGMGMGMWNGDVGWGWVQVREVEAGVFSPNNRHRLSYTCSWRSVIPNQNPNHLYLPDASAPYVQLCCGLLSRTW